MPGKHIFHNFYYMFHFLQLICAMLVLEGRGDRSASATTQAQSPEAETNKLVAGSPHLMFSQSNYFQ